MKPMIANEELRRNWRRNWLGSIQEFADHDTQRRLWLDPQLLNPHFTFVEYMSCYFDGLAVFDTPTPPGESYAVARQQRLVTLEEATVVEPFHAALIAYEAPYGDYDHEAILVDAKWLGVIATAKAAQAALLPMIDDPEERSALTEISIYAIEAGAGA